MIGRRKPTQQISFEVDGIRCSHCEGCIRLALGKIPGVRRVKISRRQVVQVQVESAAEISSFTLEQVIENTGYKVNRNHVTHA